MVFLWPSYSKPMNIAHFGLRPFVGPRSRIPNLAQNQVMKRSEVGLRSNGGKSRFFLNRTGWWFGTWMLLFHLLGMSSSQLTNSIIFQRGRYATNQRGWSHQPGNHQVYTLEIIILHHWKAVNHHCLHSRNGPLGQKTAKHDYHRTKWGI